jgi:hypothetical protein
VFPVIGTKRTFAFVAAKAAYDHRGHSMLRPQAVHKGQNHDSKILLRIHPGGMLASMPDAVDWVGDDRVSRSV